MSRQDSRGGQSKRSLSGREKRILGLLRLPTFGLALGIGTVTTYGPLLARRFTPSSVLIGVVIAAEGLVALFVPIALRAKEQQLRSEREGSPEGHSAQRAAA